MMKRYTNFFLGLLYFALHIAATSSLSPNHYCLTVIIVICYCRNKCHCHDIYYCYCYHVVAIVISSSY